MLEYWTMSPEPDRPKKAEESKFGFKNPSLGKTARVSRLELTKTRPKEGTSNNSPFMNPEANELVNNGKMQDPEWN
jgi:hypothetical protein